MNILHSAIALALYLIQVSGWYYEDLSSEVDVRATKEKACVLDLNKDLPKKNEPLLLRRISSLFSLLFPERKSNGVVVAFKKGEKNQLSVFTKILGKKYADKYLGSGESFLARGHLAPDADFIFGTHQFATYFYVNAAPQWQSINAGNWLRLEANTRKIAMKLGTDLEIVTGTRGVLKLEGVEGAKVNRLQESRLPVPEYFWKILRNPIDNSCIAFVSTNNPFLKKKPKTICQDICTQYGWPLLQNDLSKGYVYCCKYQNIKKAIPEAPNLTCESVLHWIP